METKGKTRRLVNMNARGLATIRPAAQAFYVSDEGVVGLALRVPPSGKKTWSVRYRIGRRMRRLTLGGYPLITLADARARAKAALKQATNGIDPAQKKQDARTADTFGDFAQTYIDTYAQQNKSVKEMDAGLQKNVLPEWKHRLMTDITRRDVRELLAGIATRAPIVANRTRALLHKMFAVAIKNDVVESNPVTGTARPGIEHQRDRVLTHEEIRTFWTACEKLPSEMAAAWKLRLLTAQRAAEVRDMTWDELDLTDGWWTIPAARSKNGLSHRVPLAPSVVVMLTALRAAEDARLARQKTPTPSPFVLRLARGKRQLRTSAETFGLPDFRGHDLRRTAASLMAGSGVQRLVISKILNHVETGVTAVYDRHSYDAEKKVALDSWARTLTAIIEQKPADVLAFARG